MKLDKPPFYLKFKALLNPITYGILFLLYVIFSLSMLLFIEEKMIYTEKEIESKYYTYDDKEITYHFNFSDSTKKQIDFETYNGCIENETYLSEHNTTTDRSYYIVINLVLCLIINFIIIAIFFD
jgi:hypothetical protein